MRNKDSRKIETIFQSALSLIEEKGIAGLSMAEIAKNANLATGTLYIYFSTKEILIQSLYKETKLNFSKRLYSGFNNNMEVKEGFKILWFNYVNLRAYNFKESLFLEQFLNSPYVTDKEKKLSTNLSAPIHKLFEKGKKEGSIVIEDNSILISIITGTTREIAALLRNKKINDTQVNNAFRLCWKSISIDTLKL